MNAAPIYSEEFEGWGAVGAIIGELMHVKKGEWSFSLEQHPYTKEWIASIGNEHSAGKNPQQAVARLLNYVLFVQEEAA